MSFYICCFIYLQNSFNCCIGWTAASLPFLLSDLLVSPFQEQPFLLRGIMRLMLADRLEDMPLQLGLLGVEVDDEGKKETQEATLTYAKAEQP